MKRSKKNALAALALVTGITATLSACSSNNGNGNGNAQPSNAASATSSAAPSGSAPASAPADGKIVSEPLTLSYFVQMSGSPAPGIKTLNDMAAYQETEKKTGIHIDFKHPAVGQEKNQFNLLMSTGDYPDVIEWGWNDYPGGGVGALNSGVIIPLNEYIEKYAPNLTKLLEENPDIRKDISTDDGRIYAFPFLRSDPYLRTYFGLGVRQDWLDKLGLAMPTTIDEWHGVLQAFKEKDPNGNGKADEIPLLIRKDTLLNFSNVFLNAYGASGRFNLEGDKVVYGPLKPEYKTFLQTMRAWYEQGLIDKEYAGTDDKQKDAKWTGELVGSSEMAVGGGIGKYTNAMAGKNPDFKLAGAPYPVLNKGDKPSLGQREPIFNSLGAASRRSNGWTTSTEKKARCYSTSGSKARATR